MNDSQDRRVLLTGGSGFIGTHMCTALLSQSATILNLDIAAPNLEQHEPFWSEVDILDRDRTIQTVAGFSPTEVIHLAARTDMGGSTVSDYSTNTDGTRNVCDAILAAGSVKRAVFTSSQFVFGPGPLPADDTDFAPHTVYGESKVEGELIVRKAELGCTWTIVRPTNIWGPWHPRYPTEFWLVLKRGLYLHPGTKPVIRSYGYVRNVVSQIGSILATEESTVAGQVFYLGDAPIVLKEWVDAFACGITGRPAPVVPRWALGVLGRIGDAARAMSIPAPIFSSRVRSMTEDYLTPMQRTLDTIGAGPYTLEEGVIETIEWLRESGW